MSIRSLYTPINRSQLDLYLGYGKSRWTGGILPESNDKGEFILDRMFGNVAPAPDSDARITIDGGFLKIDKYLADNYQRAWYSFGRLDAPAEDSDPIMVEFEVLVYANEVVSDSRYFTGIMFGLFTGDSGFTVKFYSKAGKEPRNWMEMHNSDQNATAAPDASYVVEYDWNGGLNIFKVLWDPQANRVLMLCSYGEVNDFADLVMIDGRTSDFQQTPEDQRRVHQPIAFFGHGHATPTGISRWTRASIYNLVSKGIDSGIYQGEHAGNIVTDNVINYTPDRIPDRSFPSWLPLSSGWWGTVDGSSYISEQQLVLLKRNRTASYGFYRSEPAVVNYPSILDFWISGEVFYQGNGVQSTGVEVYIADGSYVARVALLYDYTSRSIGILTTLYPDTYTGAYIGTGIDWTTPQHYRIIYDPSSGALLYLVENSERGLSYSLIASVGIDLLPEDTTPSPGIGFIHNGEVGETEAQLNIQGIRFLSNARLWFGDFLPDDSWEFVGSGLTSITSGTMKIDGNGFYTRSESTDIFTSAIGYTLEFRTRITDYGDNNPERTNTGVGVAINDGSQSTMVLFADAGPEIGKIVYLPNDTDFDEVLAKIRAGDPSMSGLYAKVDWSTYKTYRLERTIGGKVQLFIDDIPSPVISIPHNLFTYLPSMGGPFVLFGNFVEYSSAKSDWEFLYYSLSLGFDIKIDRVMELEEKFDSVINVIASFAEVAEV